MISYRIARLRRRRADSTTALAHGSEFERRAKIISPTSAVYVAGIAPYLLMIMLISVA
jgi:hypothetical protein